MIIFVIFLQYDVKVRSGYTKTCVNVVNESVSPALNRFFVYFPLQLPVSCFFPVQMSLNLQNSSSGSRNTLRQKCKCN
jgi:hypothetical protein